MGGQMKTKKKILIVDDSTDIVALTQKLLETRGFDVLTLSQGNRTLEVTKAGQPDLILLDMILEDKTGAEICHEIKSDPATKNIPVIITTGHVNTTDTVKQNFIEPNAYLIKPFELTDLLTHINQFLTP